MDINEKSPTGQGQGVYSGSEQCKDMQFSYYKAPVKNTIPCKNVSLSDCHIVIKSGKYKHVTETLRSITDKEEKTAYKAQNFDYITASGTFAKRANTALLQHSNLFCADLTM